jgi:hypothetical protein
MDSLGSYAPTFECADYLADTKQYSLQFFYKTEREERYAGVPGLAPGA